MIRELFETKERDLVHIAIDLMIAYITGQRFPSDQLNITEKII